METYTRDRKPFGDKAEAKVAAYLNSTTYRWMPLRLEHLVDDNAWRSLIECAATHEALNQFRYMPDFFCLNSRGKPFYLDAKAGTHIERRCYERYLTIAKTVPVFLAFWQASWPNNLKIVNVKNLVLFGEWAPGAGGSQLPCKQYDVSTVFHEVEVPKA